MKNYLITSFSLLLGAIAYQAQGQCGTSPVSGLTTITSTEILNSYYPGTGNPLAGTTSLTLGARDARGAATELAAGDLVLIIQMQGADLNTDNTDSYGDGVSGAPASGSLSTGSFAGNYEYNSVASVSGGLITFSYALINNYYTRDFSASTGLRRYQLIRIPRYYDLTINSGITINAPGWNGSNGGLIVLDAVNTMTINGLINVNGLGFRGGGGKQFQGATAGNSNGVTSLLNTDYRFHSAITNPANLTGGAKGEGIAGTPAYTYTTGSVLTATGLAEGYTNGSMGRGAPANAGGGGTDGLPLGSPGNNQYNTGGGGGSNAGSGGQGGNGWPGASGSPGDYPYGGFGGSPFNDHALARLIPGGGGGAGTANNSTTANEYQSSGGAGGGIILIRANSFAGSGSLLADGAAAPGINGTPSSNTDAAGGGGGGGSIVAVSKQNTGVGLTGISASAAGGAGGNSTNHFNHGPGGGGGGGIIYTNGMFASSTVTGGLNGKTRSGSAGGPIDNDFGAMPGTAGTLITLSAAPILVDGANLPSPCGVLPVTIISLKGLVQQNGQRLIWEIADAQHVAYFEVLYSSDGINFISVGRTDFDPSRSIYEFLHTLTPPGITYYRLKIVDIDGSYMYSRIIALRTGRTGDGLLLYPNPATDRFTLQLISASAGEVHIRIIDATGKIVEQRNSSVQSGDNVIELETGKLKAGFYLVELVRKDGTRVRERLLIRP